MAEYPNDFFSAVVFPHKALAPKEEASSASRVGAGVALGLLVLI